MIDMPESEIKPKKRVIITTHKISLEGLICR